MTPRKTFVCFLCKQVKPTKELELPCAYTDSFGHRVCRACCEACYKSEPFPCRQYARRVKKERRRANKAKQKGGRNVKEITKTLADWVKDMDARARKSKAENGGGPEVQIGYYAVKKIGTNWHVSNGRAWWDNPVLVREFHEYPDGLVCSHYYIEGVQLFGRKNIENSGLKAMRPSEVANVLPLAKVVYFDHRKMTDGRAKRTVYDVSGPEGMEQPVGNDPVAAAGSRG